MVSLLVIEQLEEALNERELVQGKFKEKMKEVIQKLKEEIIQLAKLKRMQ